MSIFKKIFTGKNKREKIDGMPDTHEVSLDKILSVASYIPVDYTHTQKFYEDGIDPLAYEKQRLQGMPVDYLLQDRRIPAIIADSQHEIEITKRQYINHLYTINTITDLQNGVIAHVDNMITRVDDEITSYIEEEQKLRALLER